MSELAPPSKAEAENNNHIFAAILWMLGAMFSLFTVSLLAKELAAQYDTVEIMFYRSAFAFPLFCFFIWATGRFSDFKLKAFKLHFMRNITHFTAQNLWFYALATMPLAVVITFEFTTPAWVIIIAALVLGEGFGIRRALVIGLSILGVLLVNNPGSVEFTPSLFAALTCAILFATTMIFTKRLTKVQNTNEILFMMILLQTLLAAVIVVARFELEPPHWDYMFYLILMAITGTSSHYCITRALSLADASIVSPIDLLRLPLSVLASYFLYHEEITLLMVFGASILVLANYINIKRKKK